MANRSGSLPPALVGQVRKGHMLFFAIGLFALAYGVFSRPTDWLSITVGAVVSILYGTRAVLAVRG